jgi:PAS domain S-box-containing protein
MADSSEPLGLSRSGSSEPKANILLVDDNPANLLSLRAILDDLGQNIVEARSGDEAIQRVQADDYAVILLNVLMPGLSGLETARTIRSHERSWHIPIIFLSASDIDRSQTEEAYRLGAVDFLVKPLLPIVLQAKVRGFVELFQDKQRAKREAEQLRLLVHGTTDYAIFLLDPEGRIASWNPGAERLKGYKAEEIIGQHFSRFYPQDAIDRGWPAHELTVAAREGRFEDEGWRVRKDGSQFWANVVITALHDEAGNLRGFSKITRDLTERRRAEEAIRQANAELERRVEERTAALRESAERLHEQACLLDLAHVLIRDVEGHIVLWNQGAARMYGFRKEEAEGHVSHALLRTEFPKPLGQITTDLLRDGEWQGELIHTRQDGSRLAVASHWALHRDDTGQPVRVVEVNNDVTELKRLRTALHDERERLRVTLVSIGDAVITTDTEGRITFLNGVAESLTGWTNAEAAGQPLEAVFRIVNEDSRQPVENPALRALKEGVVVGLANQTVLIRKDGTERPIDDSAAPVRDGQGHVVGCVLVFRDVTERRRLEKENADRLRAARQLAAIVESSEDAIVSKSLDGIIQTWNATAERLFGFTAEQAEGQHISLIIPADRAKEEEEIIARIRAGEKVEHFDTVRVRSDGQPIPISLTISPIRDETGRIVGASKIARDITDRKQAEERIYSLMAELKQADKRKDEFLATLAHELRNPLAPIRNALALMRQTRDDKELIEDARRTMERQMTQMVRLVDDLMDVNRINQNKLQLRKQRIDLAAVVQSAVETSRPLIEQGGHQLTVMLPQEAIPLDGDLTRLAQVFANLLTNAAKYTEQGGRIWLTAERVGSNAIVTVRDTGIGIPAEAMPALFEMFSQVERSLERSQGGLGIGLMLVKRLTEMHGGTIEAHSEGPSKGSEFIVRLPLVTEKPKPPKSEAEKAITVSGRRILVVDDLKDSAQSLAILLKVLGNEVRTAYDGEEAVRAAEEHRPEVILLDIGLPKLNGYEAARRIRERLGNNVVMIALSGWGGEADRRRATEAGFNAHMTKPVELDTLQKLLLGSLQ